MLLLLMMMIVIMILMICSFMSLIALMICADDVQKIMALHETSTIKATLRIRHLCTTPNPRFR